MSRESDTIHAHYTVFGGSGFDSIVPVWSAQYSSAGPPADKMSIDFGQISIPRGDFLFTDLKR